MKCDVCEKSINDKYVVDEWGNKSHMKHYEKGVSIDYILCESCLRIISPNTSKGGYQHKDGRTICGICYQSAITTKEQINKSYKKVIDLFRLVGFENIPSDISISLSWKNELSSDGLVEGLAIYSIDTLTGKKFNHRIKILRSIPKIKFEAVLAHELLHVWLHRNDIKLNRYEEGFCNIGSTLVYNHYNNKFSQILNNNMKRNPDKEYGVDFITIKKVLKQKGWKQFLAFIKANYK